MAVRMLFCRTAATRLEISHGAILDTPLLPAKKSLCKEPDMSSRSDKTVLFHSSAQRLSSLRACSSSVPVRRVRSLPR